MKKKTHLDDAQYEMLLKLSNNSPIPTADFVPIRRCDGGAYEFALSMRTEEPYRGKYFAPGGRIIGTEKIEEAVRRYARKELGIVTGEVRFVGHITVRNPPKRNIRWLSLWHFHTVEIAHGIPLTLNRENARVMWFTHIARRWPKPVRTALELAGFTYR